MMNISLVEGMVASLVFLPGDVTKVVVASIIAVKLMNTVPFRKEVHV